MADPSLTDGEVMTNAEKMARDILTDALRGDKVARSMILERVEGKAVRAAQVQNADTSYEDQIDQAAVALLNGLVPEATKTTETPEAGGE